MILTRKNLFNFSVIEQLNNRHAGCPCHQGRIGNQVQILDVPDTVNGQCVIIKPPGGNFAGRR